jgi:hypothetical protein
LIVGIGELIPRDTSTQFYPAIVLIHGSFKRQFKSI